jgi:hypothetical protein
MGNSGAKTTDIIANSAVILFLARTFSYKTVTIAANFCCLTCWATLVASGTTFLIGLKVNSWRSRQSSFTATRCSGDTQSGKPRTLSTCFRHLHRMKSGSTARQDTLPRQSGDFSPKESENPWPSTETNNLYRCYISRRANRHLFVGNLVDSNSPVVGQLWGPRSRALCWVASDSAVNKT